MPKDDWPATWHNALARAVFLASVAGVMLGWPKIRTPLGRALASAGLLGLLWLDVRTHAPDLNPTVPLEVYEPGLARAQLGLNPAPGHGASRLMVSPSSLAKMRHTAVASPAQDYLGRRLALYGNCNLLDGLPKLNGFYPLYLREMEEVLSLLYGEGAAECPGMVSFLNVSHRTAPDRLMDWVARRPLLPLATAGQEPVFLGAEAVLERLGDPEFDPRRTVFMPETARGQIAVRGQSTARVLASRFGVREAEVEVEGAEPSLVVIAQAYYPCWKARVDGESTRLWRANHAFQAVEVPAGRHVVRLVYVDDWFRWGAAVSGLALLGCALGWVACGGRGRARLETSQERDAVALF